MKKIVLSAAAAVLTMASAYAQTDHFHVFRNDRAINSFKGSDVMSITHEDGNAASGFNKLVVTTSDGSTTIPLSAIDSVQVRAFDIPDFYINLTDPSYANLTDLITSLGKSYVYEATLRMDGNGMYDDLPEQTVEFRGRGNSTWNMPKKPYRFKMAKKVALCGMKKAKSFALIANFIDNSLMRNTTALWVSNFLKLPFSNHCTPVNVYLNGNYRGAYMLTEKIGTGSGSVDIDEYKGVLFELDSNYDEDYKFMYTWRKSGSYNTLRLPVMVKDPDFTEICDSLGVTPNAYLQTWQNDFTTMANAVTSSPADADLSQYIDIDQAARYFLVNSLANNHEMKHPKSMYIYKDSIGGVYKFGPTWDFDWAFMFENYNNETASASVPLVSNNGDYAGADFCKALFANQGFREAYQKYWDDFVENGYPALLEYLDQYAAVLEPSAKRNGLLWENELKSYASNCFDFKQHYDELKNWLDKRVQYCNSDANWGLY
ncbi:MAG: CotH kinase family protein [Bacteroides sp.]|nr:CotH kinase family protein [Bacteroides sp.]MCM1412838.1 CotH kinase family protein [Bacteroides sp.]MCM1471507.1 CotH kinase family protein [Bacteroides sp.]